MEGSEKIHKTLDDLKEEFSKDIDSIINKTLTPDNVENFAGDALREAVDLSDKMQKEYKENPNFNKDERILEDGAQIEDFVCEELSIMNIGNLLDSINKVKGIIDGIKTNIEQYKNLSSNIITPTDKGQISKKRTGEKPLKEKKHFERLFVLVYILEKDYGLKINDDYSIVESKMEGNTVRQEPYYRIFIESLNRIVYICDEEGNVSYVFDSQKIAESGIDLGKLDNMTKEEKNRLISENENAGIAIQYSPRWRSIISGLLKPDTKISDKKLKKIREFAEEISYPDYPLFERQVREAWQGAEKIPDQNVQEWYLAERRNNHRWPYNPSKFYKNKGWKSYPDLVGKFLSFKDFLKEVLTEWKLEEGGKGSVERWYRKKVKQKPNWPTNPDVFYREEKEEGEGKWVSWVYLVSDPEDNK